MAGHFQSHAHRKDPGRADPIAFAEGQEVAMLYRHQVEFGVGHRVSLHADCPDGTIRRTGSRRWLCPPTRSLAPRDRLPPICLEWQA